MVHALLKLPRQAPCGVTCVQGCVEVLLVRLPCSGHSWTGVPRHPATQRRRCVVLAISTLKDGVESNLVDCMCVRILFIDAARACSSADFRPVVLPWLPGGLCVPPDAGAAHPGTRSTATTLVQATRNDTWT